MDEGEELTKFLDQELDKSKTNGECELLPFIDLILRR
jgi:hypothetical protein